MKANQHLIYWYVTYSVVSQFYEKGKLGHHLLCT